MVLRQNLHFSGHKYVNNHRFRLQLLQYYLLKEHMNCLMFFLLLLFLSKYMLIQGLILYSDHLQVTSHNHQN